MPTAISVARLPSLFTRAILRIRLSLRGRFARKSVTGALPVVVSLTTFGQRLSCVHLTIESIARGTDRPQQLVLWLDNDQDIAAAGASKPLRRLVRRGLSIQRSTPMGPHSKYFPYVMATHPHVLPLVTADDDIIYPVDWLKPLFDAYVRSPEVIHCYRAHRVILGDHGVAPYSEWPPVTTSDPRYDSFLTGVSGVIYPPAFLEHLRARGEAFRDHAPKADDVWLHAQAVEHGTKVSQLSSQSVHHEVVLGTQRVALWRHNATGNDEQITATYSAAAIERLRSEEP